MSHNVEEPESAVTFTNSDIAKRLQEEECGEIGLFPGA